MFTFITSFIEKYILNISFIPGIVFALDIEQETKKMNYQI